jgi:hypothetical protein
MALLYGVLLFAAVLVLPRGFAGWFAPRRRATP